MKITQQILVTGRVQGVSYRYFTKSCAVDLGVNGWVRNLKDGRVEAVIQGDAKSIEELRQLLTQGPVRAEVRQLEVREVQSITEFLSFEISADGEEPWPTKK